MKRHWQIAAGTRRSILLAAAILWLGACSVGFALLAAYDNTAGLVQPTPSEWPVESHLRLGHSGATLVLFAHPRCPCTRATLGELEKVVAHSPDRFTTWVVFFKPSSMPEGWDETDLWNTAASIPGVQVVLDVDGQEAVRFHATTSGQTLLYSERGELLFNGGITFARGHAGDNVGRAAIESYLRTGSPGDRCTPVFGCPIAAPGEPL